MYKVGDEVSVNNRAGVKGEGEIIALLDRMPPNTQPNIVVKLRGLKGEYVQAVFEQDIVPPAPTVITERWINIYRFNDERVGYEVHTTSEAAKRRAFAVGSASLMAGQLRITELSDGTWHIEKVE